MATSDEFPGGGGDTAGDEVSGYRVEEPVSSLSGYFDVARYRCGPRIIDIETAIVKKGDPPPDLSAGWRVCHEYEDILVIQRVLK